LEGNTIGIAKLIFPQYPKRPLFNPMPFIKSPSCSLLYNQAAMMTGTATLASALECYPSTITDGDKPSLETRPAPPPTVSNFQYLNVLDGDETMKPQPTTGFQLTASPKDNVSGVIMSSAAETGVQDVDDTVERKKGERGGGVEMEGAVELEFMLFPRLPIELRLKIWKYALPGPRVVEIEWNPKTRQWFCPFESQSESSSLSRTYRESREVYHKTYLRLAKVSRVHTQSIVSDATDPFHESSQHITSYFDSTIDILYIGTCSSEDLCVTFESFQVLAASPWVQKVRLLVIEYQQWSESRQSSDTGVKMQHQILSLLPNLTAIILVLGDINYESLLSNAERWASRPHARLSSLMQSMREFHHGLKQWLPRTIKSSPAATG
jgi:hypothetical protein